MLLLLMLVACTEDAAEVDNLVRGEEYVQVRMQVPGMKAAATRAEDGVIKSITALVYRGGVLKKIETAKELTTTSFKMPKPLKDDVIHFLANLPDDYSLPEIGTNESALCDLTTDHQTLCYWGKYTYNDEAVINTLTLYRNMAMITIAPDPNGECTFPEDQLFIAGLVNANQTGALVPYDEGFNFDLTTNDYFTLPADVETETDAEERPLVTSLYVLEHDNPDAYTEANKDKFFYVICKIGKYYYYKVALTSDGVNPYDIIRNHKYTIYVHDLDEGARTYADALDDAPINLRVIVTTDLVFSYTENPTVYLNGGKDATLPVTITVPQDASLTEFNIATTNFTVTSSNGGTLTETQTGYTYAGGSTTFTFTPKSDLAVGAYTITLSGKGNYLYDFNEEVSVTVDATMMAVTPTTATINMDNGQENTKLTLTKPGNVDNVEVSVSADVFNVANNGNEYTFTPKNSNIAAGDYTVTFADSKYSQVSTTATITVVNTPKVTFTNTGSQTLYWNNGSATSFQVQMNGVPDGKSVTLSITGAAAFTITDANSNELQLDGDNYPYTGGNTTFTIKPKDENSVRDAAYTIGFSGTGNGVNVVPAEVSVTVKASSSALFATSGTINMDNSETSTTITLTKPASVQNVELRITNANGENVNDRFTLSANPSNNVEYNNSIFYIREYNNNTNLSVTFTVKDNAIITSGEYTATFTGNYNGQNITATATITIVKTPSVSFSNTSDKTLYWNNGSPTSFQVQMTGVPDGKSVTLSIANASAFTITASSGTLSATNNGYSYTGGNTTFTITPKDAGSVSETAHTITITGTGEGVRVPNTSISVKVMSEKPASGEVTVWTGPESLNWSNFAIDASWFEGAPEGNVQMYVYFSSASQFEVRVENNGNIGKYHDVNLNNNGFGKDPYMGNFDGLDGKLSIVIPAEKRSVSFYISGSITLTKITVVK